MTDKTQARPSPEEEQAQLSLQDEQDTEAAIAAADLQPPEEESGPAGDPAGSGGRAR